jgi:hypothetical protein
MDQETHLNHQKADTVAGAFSEYLRGIGETWTKRQRIVRALLRPDPLERLVPEKLLFEAVADHLKHRTVPSSPLVVLMNRSGHGDGARMAGGLFPLLSEYWRGISFVHVSFSTPSRGLGVLVRGLLVKAGADYDINVHVVAHNRPVEGLRLSSEDIDTLVGTADLVISFASGGGAGLMVQDRMMDKSPLLSRSHVSVLSYPDPESLVGELPTMKQILGREPDLASLRLRVQVLGDDNHFEALGAAVLGPEGDAAAQLWPLIDNARRRVYRVLIDPMSGDAPQGDSLICPCRALIKSSLAASAGVSRIVPAGARLVAVAWGNETVD